MARKGRNKKNSLLEIIIGLVVFAVIIFAGGKLDTSIINDFLNIESNPLENVEIQNHNTTPTAVDGNLVIDYIDVGQGDSILIRQGEHAMLIDGGTSESKDTILDFLEEENVTYLDYIIGTHPHEDHIGSLDDVVLALDFDTIFFPKVTTNTKTFEDLVLAVQSKEKKFKTPVVGEEYTLGTARFIILAPNSSTYQSLNDYSIAIKLTYGNNSFMFTGDAETLSEKEILALGYDLSADVLKLGHHGSTTSSSQKFLNAVSPKYAVISCGKNNTYKHPTKTTMDKMKKMNIEVYRTDEQGTIELVSNGATITFNVDPGSYNYMGG